MSVAPSISASITDSFKKVRGAVGAFIKACIGVTDVCKVYCQMNPEHVKMPSVVWVFDCWFGFFFCDIGTVLDFTDEYKILIFFNDQRHGFN